MSDAKLVLDTNIVSYLMKGGVLAEAYAPHVQGKLLAISFITVGELYFGAEKANWGAEKRKRLETTLRNFVVIPYDHEIARCYGRRVRCPPWCTVSYAQRERFLRHRWIANYYTIVVSAAAKMQCASRKRLDDLLQSLLHHVFQGER